MICIRSLRGKQLEIIKKYAALVDKDYAEDDSDKNKK